jgi:hypothetical protein
MTDRVYDQQDMTNRVYDRQGIRPIGHEVANRVYDQ